MTADKIAKKLGIKPGEDIYPQVCGVLLGKLISFNVLKYDDKSGALFDKMFGDIVA